MSQQYCAGTCEDAEDFSYRLPTWWGAALEFFSEDEDAHKDRAQDLAMDRDPVAGVVTDADMRSVTCAIARARAPVSPALMFRDAHDARRLLTDWTQDHDDYMIDCAEDYPKASDEQLRDLAQEIRCTVQEWEKRWGTAPDWFIVEHASEISYGLAVDAHELATRIDASGLVRYEHDACRWWPPQAQSSVSEDGHAIEIKTLDLWQAASLLGLIAPEKPKRLP